MSHAGIIAKLRAVTNSDLLQIDPADGLANVAGESDRAAIILETAVLEDWLLRRLKRALNGLNTDETNRMFDHRGAAGTFASRLWLAQGLEIITRPQRKKFEIIKEMRNACAHSHEAVTFDTPAIREAISYLLVVPELRSEFALASREDMRGVFLAVIGQCQLEVTNLEQKELDAETIRRVIKNDTSRRASLEKQA